MISMVAFNALSYRQEPRAASPAAPTPLLSGPLFRGSAEAFRRGQLTFSPPGEEFAVFRERLYFHIFSLVLEHHDDFLG